MVSDYMKAIYRKYNDGKEFKDEKTNKLILNLRDKTNYVVHIENLQYYLKSGMKLKRINRVIEFKQTEWLKPYIEFNTQKRKESKSDFEKDLYKLMNNSVFGKTMEDVRKHTDFKFIDDFKYIEKALNNPAMKHYHMINESLVGIENLKSKVKLNKPIYAGMSILDYSKLHMYKFYYDVLKKKFKDNIKLFNTDTDRFIIQVKTDEVYDDLNELKEYMDFSDYPVNHKCYSNENKKKLGCFKDETNSRIIEEFIGLRAKMYVFKLSDEVVKKAKGVPKKSLSNVLFDNYKNTLYDEEFKKDYVNFNCLRSQNHNIYLMNINKVSLSNLCNKRCWTSNLVSLPYGHYSLN